MTLIDTHTHLYLPEFDEDRDLAVSRALEAGITTMILPNVDLTTIDPMKRLAERYPDNMRMAMGLHPTEIGPSWRDDLAATEAELDKGGYVAVGEIGIDLYWDKTYESQQMQAFEHQVSLAVDAGLPVIIHCREGLPQALEVLSGFGDKVRGVFHSFGGTTADVDRVRRTGDFYFGINGIVTFKNSTLRSVLPAIGADRVLLETDAPYLAPVPHRGKRNETAHMVHTAATVADSLRLTTVALADATTVNARTLFNL